MADVVIVSKVDTATSEERVARALATVARVNPRARRAGRPRGPSGYADLVRGRRVLVVEDGPTIAHGSMPHGAGFVAATAAGAAAIVDPRPSAAPELAEVFARYPHIGPVLPAVGYSPAQVEALRATIEDSDADVVLAATPVDLARLLTVSQPIVRARYEFEDGGPTMLGDSWIDGSLGSRRPSGARPPHRPVPDPAT